MKAYEFPIKVSSEGSFEIPASVVERLPRGDIVRVIVLVSEPTDIYEQSEWAYLTAKEFFAGYSDADSIHDRLE